MAAIHDDVRAATDLIGQPLVLEVLAGAEFGHTPRDAAPPGADPHQLDAAIARLTAIGAIMARPAGAGPDEAVTLTARGRELVSLLHELADPD